MDFIPFEIPKSRVSHNAQQNCYVDLQNKITQFKLTQIDC